MITYCLNFRARTVFEILLFITLILGLCSVLGRLDHLLSIHQLILRDLHNIQPFLHVGQYYSQSIILLYFLFLLSLFLVEVANTYWVLAIFQTPNMLSSLYGSNSEIIPTVTLMIRLVNRGMNLFSNLYKVIWISVKVFLQVLKLLSHGIWYNSDSNFIAYMELEWQYQILQMRKSSCQESSKWQIYELNQSLWHLLSCSVRCITQ